MERSLRHRQHGALALTATAAVLFGAGCAAVTGPGAVGPMRSGSTTQLEGAWAYAYGPATATVGGRTVTGNGQMQVAGGDTPSLPSPAPLTVGVRQSLGDMSEVSANLGEMDSGLRLRVRLSEGPGAPSDISFEARTGEISFAPTASYGWSAAFEIYPDITGANGHLRKRLILAVGAAGGVFDHELNLPYAFASDYDLPFGGPRMTVLRPEVRLQTTIGLYLGGEKRGGISVAVAPWFLLSSGTPTATCTGCGPGTTFSLTSYSQSWGAALIITPSLSWSHGR